MRFGLQLAPLSGNSLPDSCATAVQIAAAAEEFDFEILIAPQHYRSAPYRYPHALTLASYLAARTSKWVGTGVLPLALLNAVDLAEQMLALAGLTEGRCILGVGLGYRDEEFRLFNIPRAERVRRFEGNLAALRQHWFDVADNSVSGEPSRPGMTQVPIWIGASAQAGIIRAARTADAWMISPTASLDEISSGMAVYRAAGGWADYAHPLPIRRDVLVAGLGGTARETAIQRVRIRYGTYARWGASAASAGPAGQGSQPPLAAIVGDIDEIVEALHRLRETVGEGVLAILRLAWPGMSTQEVIEQIRLVGRHVVPQLQEGKRCTS